jgi:hypothetical protein
VVWAPAGDNTRARTLSAMVCTSRFKCETPGSDVRDVGDN